MRRQDLLQAGSWGENDDDERLLLSQQEEFLSKNKEPAARVTRIQRKVVSQAPAAAAGGSLASISQGRSQQSTASSSLQQQPAQPQQKQQQHISSHASSPRDASGTPLQSGQAPAGPQPPIIHMSASDVVGDIVERTPVVTGSSTSSTASIVAAPMAFPPAVHRRESKFALARAARAQAAGASSVPGCQQQQEQAQHSLKTGAVSQSSASPRAPQQSRQTPSIVPAAPSIATAAATTPASAAARAGAATKAAQPQAGGLLPEAVGIHEQNMARVAEMSEAERQAALEELASRMSPATLEFLRKRGAARMGGGAGASALPSTGAGSGAAGTQSSASAATSGRLPPATAAAVLQPPQTSSPAHSMEAVSAAPSQPTIPAASISAGGGAAKSVPTATASTHQQGSPAQQQGGGTGQSQHDQQQQKQQQEESIPADPRLVGRLRWGLEGEVVGVQAPDEVLMPSQVLLRDQLRRDEGSVPEGYTITELLLLARSSLPAHRVAALRMLAAVLMRARPPAVSMPELEAVITATSAGAGRAAAVTGTPSNTGQGTSPAAQQLLYVHIPEEILADLQAVAAAKQQIGQQGQQQQALSPAPTQPQHPSVTWASVWHYLVKELGAASHLRLALDDAHTPVAGAAAGALAALLSQGPEESLAWEVSDCCPSLGYPTPWTATLSRANPAATWESAPRDVEAVARAAGRGRSATPRQQGGEEEEEELTAEDVAAIDPVAGLLQMSLVPRVRYLLGEAGVGGQDAVQLLRLLMACALHSPWAAVEVLRCPGLCDLLKSLLLPGGPAVTQGSAPHNSASTTIQAGGSSREGSTAEMTQLLPHLLHLMCLLAQSSPSAAQLLQARGLLPLVQSHLLMACSTLLPEQTPIKANGAPNSSSITLQPNGAAGAGAVQQLVVLIECLRIWRACASHGVYAWSFEAVYPTLCRSLLPPAAASQPATPLQASGQPETNSTSSYSAAQLPGAGVAGGQWHLAREAHLTLAAVLAQALRVAKDQKHGGAHQQQQNEEQGLAMIEPGTAAAVAREVGAAWLAPGVLRAVAEEVVGLQARDLALELTGDRERWLEWCHAGVHPTLLLPPAFAALSSLSAVLHMLGTYWHSVDPHLDVFGEVAAQLTAAGLLTDRSCLPSGPVLTSSNSTHSNPGYQQQGAGGGSSSSTHGNQQHQGCEPHQSSTPSLAPHDALAVALLHRHDTGSAHHQESSGSALTAYCLAMLDTSQPLACLGNAKGASTVTCPQAAKRCLVQLPAHHALHAASCELLSGTMALGTSLPQQPASQQPDDESQSAASTTTSTAKAVGKLVGDMLPPLSRSLVAAAASWQQGLQRVPFTERGKTWGPWHSGVLQPHQHTLRLFLAAARYWLTVGNSPTQQLQPCVYDSTNAEGTSYTPASISSGSGSKVDAGSERCSISQGASSSTTLMDGLLSVMVLSPPGAEQQCLTALELLTSQPLLTPVLAAAQQEIGRMGTSAPQLHRAACGLSPCAHQESMASPDDQHQRQPGKAAYPPPSVADSADSTGVVAAAGLALRHGYMAAWLSMVPEGPDQDITTTSSATNNTQKEYPAPQISRRPWPVMKAVHQGVSNGIRLPDGGEGSRLPLPPTWLIDEALQLPAYPGATSAPHNRTRTGASVGSQRAGSSNQAAGAGGSTAAAGVPAPHPVQKVHPVGAALALALGLESSGSQYLGCCIPGGPGAKLQASIKAAYLYDSSQLVHMAKQQGAQQKPRRVGSRGGRRRGQRAGRAGSDGELEPIVEMDQEEGEEEEGEGGQGSGSKGEDEWGGDGDGVDQGQWREPWVRWALAALTALWALEPTAPALPPEEGTSTPIGPAPPPLPQGATSPHLSTPTAPSATAATAPPAELRISPRRWVLPGNWCSVGLAERLSEQFGATSFGDPLYAVHIAALLLPATSPAVTHAVWSALSQDQALHLLPPLMYCLGAPEQYTTSPSKDQSLAARMAGSLGSGELNKSAECGSVAWHVAVATVMSHICDPLAASGQGQPTGGVSTPSLTSAADGTFEGATQDTPDAASLTGSAGGGLPAAPQPDSQKVMLRAQAMARNLVSALSPDTLAQVMLQGEACGWARSVQAPALVQACVADVQALSKLRFVVSEKLGMPV